VPFTLRNLREDLEEVGSNFDGPPDLEFRLATKALELEESGLSYQRVPPTNRWRAGATRAAAWRAQESTRRLFRAGAVEREFGRLKNEWALARARVVSLAAYSVRPGYWPGDEQGVHGARSG
jgi:hypothetical protein